MREKFNNIINNISISNEELVDNSVKIADEFAIGFAEWCSTKTIIGADMKKLYKEQLQIYKKYHENN